VSPDGQGREPSNERPESDNAVAQSGENSSDETISLDDIPAGSYLLTGTTSRDLHETLVQFVGGVPRVDADGSEGGAGVLVSTDVPPTRVSDQLRRHAADDVSVAGTTETAVENHCAVIGALDQTSRREETRRNDTPRSPGDFRAVGLRITESLRQLGAASRSDVRLGYSSLSTVLMYTDARTVFQFLHVLAGRLGDVEGTALFALNSAAHDEQTVHTLTHAVDGRIRVDCGETVRIRSADVTPIPAEWTPLSTGRHHDREG
jgi:hypothetical protein